MGSLKSLVLGRVFSKDPLEVFEEVVFFGLLWRQLKQDSSGILCKGGVQFFILQNHRLFEILPLFSPLLRNSP